MSGLIWKVPSLVAITSLNELHVIGNDFYYPRDISFFYHQAFLERLNPLVDRCESQQLQCVLPLLSLLAGADARIDADDVRGHPEARRRAVE